MDDLPKHVLAVITCPKCHVFFSATKTGFACSDWSHGGIVTTASMRHKIAAAIVEKQPRGKGKLADRDRDNAISNSLKEARRIIRMLKNQGAVKHEVAPAKR